MNESVEPFSFRHGATWMDLDGRIYVVPGFHEEWIQSHPDLAGDCRTVIDMVLKKGWISIVVFGEGYVEICLDDAANPKSAAMVHEYLSRNADKWSSALIMPMRIEGFIQLSRDGFGNREDFARFLADEAGKR